MNKAQRRAYLKAFLFYVIGLEMREADFEVLELLTFNNGDPTVEEYSDAVVEYVWDHLLGEPDDLTTDAIKENASPLTDLLRAR